jgi:hypothetical protein
VPEWLLRLATQKKKRAPVAKLEQPGQADSADTALGRLFAELSLLGSLRDAGKRVVVCPWQKDHTTGKLLDTSTVIFPASAANGLGGFHCSMPTAHGAPALKRFENSRGGETPERLRRNG